VNQSRLSSSDTTATVLPSDVVASGRCGGCLPVDVELMDVQAVGGYLAGHNLKHTQAVYGFFAIVLGLMSWLYLSAQVTLYAAEVNVVRARRLWPRSILQPPLPKPTSRPSSTSPDKKSAAPSKPSTWNSPQGSESDPDGHPLAPRPARHLADARGSAARVGSRAARPRRTACSTAVPPVVC
jgi:Virulence factor BrkB